MNPVQVAVAVIENAQGEFLIAKRPSHLHMGGYWEFPGGKVESDETVFMALQREIREELNLQIDSAVPFIRIPFQYPEKLVVLDVWRVTEYSGEAMPMENQLLKWVSFDDLSLYPFPPANRSILTALKLPERLLITGAFQTAAECLYRTQRAVERYGIAGVQFRAPHLSVDKYRDIAEQLGAYCEQNNIQFFVNAPSSNGICGVTGVHLTTQRLLQQGAIQREEGLLLSAACHDDKELAMALAAAVDFVLFSPIKLTSSHPDTVAKGWDALRQFISNCPVPVYALGGMQDDDLVLARQCGAQGIAAISVWW